MSVFTALVAVIPTGVVPAVLVSLECDVPASSFRTLGRSALVLSLTAKLFRSLVADALVFVDALDFVDALVWCVCALTVLSLCAIRPPAERTSAA